MRGNGSHGARLGVIEERLRPGVADPLIEEARRFEAALREIIGTMTLDHARLLTQEDGGPGVERLRQEVRERAARAALRGAGSGGGGYDTPAGFVASPLAAQFSLSLQVGADVDAMQGVVRPLAMPAAVAEVYLSDAGALTVAECTSCRYQLPVLCGWRNGETGRDPGPAGPCNLCGQHLLSHGEPRCGGRLAFEACPLCGGLVGAHACRNERSRSRGG